MDRLAKWAPCIVNKCTCSCICALIYGGYRCSSSQALSRCSPSYKEFYVLDALKGILCLMVEVHLLLVDYSVFLCWGLAPWTSKLPSRVPAAAPTADLVHNLVATWEEPARAPTAAPSAAPPALSHDRVQSSCHSWSAVSLYGTRMKIRITVWIYYLLLLPHHSAI